MSNNFIYEIIKALIINVVLVGIFVFFFQKFIEHKIKPLTAEETLRKENFLNAKRDVFYEAIDILNRTFANSNFTLNGVPQDTTNRLRGCKYPSELEVNSCFSKLCIYSNDAQIPLKFYTILVPENKNIRPVYEMSIFINLIRNDLGYGDIKIDLSKDQYRFISVHRKDAE